MDTTLKAAVYIKLPHLPNVKETLEYERARTALYCDLQDYNMLTVIESMGENTALWDGGWNKIRSLVKKREIDIVVLPGLDRLSRHVDDVLQILNELYHYGVKVDCIGKGVLAQDFIERYIEASLANNELLYKKLREYIESPCEKRRGAKYIC